MDITPDLSLPRGTLVLVTGPSGSGKSQSIPLLLSRVEGDPASVEIPEQPEDLPIIDMLGANRDAMSILSAVGLADATALARLPGELSVGQQARASLAWAIAQARDVILVDEWLAALDRPTAKAVAWATQRALRKFGKTAIMLTAQDDIAEHFAPDVQIIAGWQEQPEIIHRTERPGWCSLIDELKCEKGTAADWHRLKPLHYAAGDPATVHSIWKASHPELRGPAAVMVISYPDLHSSARNLGTDNRYKNVTNPKVARVLNREVLKMSRLVVAPQFRGIGVAHFLMSEAIPRLGVRYVESVTAMGRFSNFLARVGFREVPIGTHTTEAELADWTARKRPPPMAHLDGQALLKWIEGLSVRDRREGRRIIWHHYHHFILHRRTRGPRPKNVPNPTDERWGEAADLAARRIIERPSYWIMGPMDPMTGLPEHGDLPPVQVASE